MKILVIKDENPYDESNATNNRFLSLAEELVKLGIHLDLVFLNGYRSITGRKKFLNYTIYNKMNGKYLIPFNYNNFFVRQLFYRFLPTHYFVLLLRPMIKKRHYDAIWLDYGPKTIKVGLLLFRYKIGANFIHERSEYSWIGLGKKSLHNNYLYNFLPNIDVFFVMTSALIDYYKKYIGEKTILYHLPMTVDFSRFNNESIKNCNINVEYIGYCGTMNNKKDGIDILIKSFIKIKDEFPNICLYLAGPTFPKEDYQEQLKIIKKYDAENRIIYLGSILRDEMPGFLMKAKVLALARPNSKQAEGGFPTKLGEYLATGKPVCITKVGEIKNYLEDGVNVFFAEPGNVNSFAVALRNALTDPNAITIGQEGKKIANKYFNKEIQGKKMFDLLKILIKK
jgi:glycosyltransferase involved in cell wall biosynthesis